MGAPLVIGSVLGSLISGGFDLWAQGKQEKQAAAQNAVYGKQYKQERADQMAVEKWRQNFEQNKEGFNEYQTNLSNIHTWAKDMEGIVNSNQALKNNLLNVWNKSRSF